MKRLVILMLGMAIMTGCVERTMTLDTTPSGALVYMNDQEIGRTPLTRDFTWYGNYDVIVRAEGYETLKTETNVKAPWWQWVPFDLFAEILPLPFKDHQHFTYALTPAPSNVDPEALLHRGQEMKAQLESSKHVPPTTQP